MVAFGRVGFGGRQVERLLIPADRVVGRERVAGRVAGAADVAERLVEVRGAGRRNPVVRELGERRRIVRRRFGFERFGNALVGAGPAAGLSSS